MHYSMKEYYIAIPENMNLTKRLDEFLPNFDFNIDFGHFVINRILKSSSYLQEHDSNYIQQCWDDLKIYNRNHRAHLRYLCNHVPEIGNILWRKDYKKGTCYSYKVAPDYENKPLRVVTITDKTILKQVRKQRVVISNKLKKDYNFLVGYFDAKRLKVDFDNAIGYCNKQLKKGKKYTDYLKYVYSIMAIQNGEYSLSYNPNTDGRVHTNITRFPKELRKFLKYDSKHLAEIDISASIPTFIYYLLSNISTSNIHIDTIINNQSYLLQYMSTKNAVSIDSNEVQRFGQLVLQKKFYETFIDDFHSIHLFDESLQPDEYYLENVKRLLGYEFDGDIDDLRDVVKKNILSMFNAKSGDYINEEAVFNSHFPTILKFIKTLKSKRNKHNYFSYLMLQIESYFMIHITARQLNNKYKRKIPIFSLHDCLITTEDNLEKVNNFMQETLEKELGFKPILKPFIYK